VEYSQLREFWRKLELEDRGGATLYPLSDVNIPVASNLEKITHDMIFEDDVINTRRRPNRHV
jgi:hypothetical protein